METTDGYRTLGVRISPSRSNKLAVSGADDVQVDLLAQADRMDADLIVSGAYGHSRAYEWVLGGVTRHLLHACERFVFFSH